MKRRIRDWVYFEGITLLTCLLAALFIWWGLKG